ncbi:amino acid transporter, partial [Aspergillus sclerotiicarbonarius CBS 121057]
EALDKPLADEEDGHTDTGEGQVTHGSFKRVHNVWTASAYQVLMMASWTCNIVLYGTVFDVGGPMMLIYSTIIVTCGQCLLMASLGECVRFGHTPGVSSTAYTKHLAPVYARCFLSYLIGWMVYLGEIAASAGCAMNSAQIITAVVQLHDPSYVPTRWHTWLIYGAILLASILFSFSRRHLLAVTVIGGMLTLGGGIAWAVTFLVLADKHDAAFLFHHLVNQSGYTSIGWVGLLSFYTPVYTLYGTDGILHITEEIRDPERNAPRAMVLSMGFSGITSLMGAVVLGFCAGDWQSYMQSDLPFIPWFVETLGSGTGAIVLAIVVLVFLNFLITVCINTAASRMAWSMAIDSALPYSEVFQRLSPTFDTPVNTILLTVAAEMVIGLVVFGSDYAFQAIVSLGGVAIQIEYLTPVLMLIIRGRSVLPGDRYFDLGRLGLVVNVASVCWSLLIIVILLYVLLLLLSMYFPSDGTETDGVDNMNWAGVMCGGLVIIVTVDWVLRGRFHYTVPAA